MRRGRPTWTTRTVLLALLAVPFMSQAQEQPQEHAKTHTHYTLVDIGTLGGPTSGVNGGAVVVNRSGTVVGASDTSVYDPGCACYISHAFKWRKGVLSDLGTLPGGAVSNAIAINSQGAVAGTSENGLIDPVYGLPAFVATIWKHGQIHDLGTLGGGFSLPNAINDRGQAAGGAANTIADPDGFGTALVFGVAIPGNQWHATLWQDGTIQDLGTLGEGPDSFAILVNETGQVAGNSYTDLIPTVFGFPTMHPFLWQKNRGMVDLGSLGGVFATSSGLNDRGQVVGFSTLTGDLTNHAFLWDQGTMQDLGTLGGIQSAANSLNNEGEIVGESLTASGQTVHAFLWKHGEMRDLGTVAGDDCSNALSINSKSEVVGESFGCDGSSHHAFLWDKGGPVIDLNIFVPPGSDLHLNEALFISDRGEIAGAAVLPNGDAHAFLLIPEKDDDDAVEGASLPTQNDVAPGAQDTARATALLARLAPRYPGFGFRLPKRGN